MRKTRSIAASATGPAIVHVIFGDLGPRPFAATNDNTIDDPACLREREIVVLRRGFCVVA